ncbi:MAG: hypothetical protein RLZZ244_2887 [Verrucomicrobiota bacterium]
MQDPRPPREACDQDVHGAAGYHRMAARHFEWAAKHHRAAADAREEGDFAAVSTHAYAAYGHQLRGVDFAKRAAEEEARLEAGEVGDWEEGEDGGA